MKKIFWFLKHLVPLRYESIFIDSQGVEWLMMWKQWFGYKYHQREWILSVGHESLEAWKDYTKVMESNLMEGGQKDE